MKINGITQFFAAIFGAWGGVFGIACVEWSDRTLLILQGVGIFVGALLICGVIESATEGLR